MTTAQSFGQRNAAWIALAGLAVVTIGGAALAQSHDHEKRIAVLEATTPIQLDGRIAAVNGSIALLNQKTDGIAESVAAMAAAMNGIRPATMAAIPVPHVKHAGMVTP